MKKKYLLAFCLGWMTSSAISSFVISAQDKRYNSLLKHSKLNFEVIKKFAEYAPYDVSMRIREEVEFDYLTLRLDDVEADSKGN